MPSDPRCHPLIELDVDAVEAMLAPVLRGATIRESARLEGGLTNTLYRVTADDGTASVLRADLVPRPGVGLRTRAPRLTLRATVRH